MPEITTAAIIRKGRFFLLAKRLPGGSMGGRWEFPGGKAERGESPEGALRREIFEEFGVPVHVGRHLVSTSFLNQGTEYLLLAFEARLEKEDLTLHEHDQALWLDPETIEGLDLADSDRKIFELIKDPAETA
jgi:8-oxo-dGTP diphosphatase